MGFTKFGEFMRILRIKHNEVMLNTAELLGVKIPFVSAVESGKRNVPAEWFGKIVNHYNLNQEEQNELKEAIEESKTQLKINLTNSNQYKRNLAVQFQRSFDDIDEETAKSIIELLNKGE